MFIRWFDNLTEKDISEVGNKALNLGKLLQEEVNVPNGFCITSECYRQVIELWELKEQLKKFIEQEKWKEASKEAEKIILSASIPQQITEEIHLTYQEMGSSLVAVRSSATSEDLPEASFAGQQETFLNVDGNESLLDAVRKCWASLWTERALHYRHQRGLNHFENNSICVIVQEMVKADFSGVIFTVDPTKNNYNSMVLEIISGLGDALVSGEKDGNLYRVNRKGKLKVVEKTIKTANPMVTEQQIINVCKEALRLEAYFSGPQDIEFSISNNQLFILQSRPITTLSTNHEKKKTKLNPIQKLLLKKTYERFPFAPKPLDHLPVSIINDSAYVGFRKLGLNIKENRDKNIPLWKEAAEIPSILPSIGVLKLPFVLKSMLSKDWINIWGSEYHYKVTNATNISSIQDLSNQDLLEKMDSVLEAWNEVMKIRTQGTLSMYASERILTILVKSAVGKKKCHSVLSDLTFGLETKTNEVNYALWQLVNLAKASPQLTIAIEENWNKEDLMGVDGGKHFTSELDKFLETYGHREGTTWYLSTPTWKQDPTLVLGLIRSLLRTDINTLPKMENHANYEESIELVSKKLRYIPGLPKLFNKMVHIFRDLQVYEEDSHFDLTRFLACLQELMSESATRLETNGFIEKKDDLFYLTYEELYGILSQNTKDQNEIQKLIESRKKEYQDFNKEWQSRISVKSVKGNKLQGTPASQGKVRGKVKIICEEKDFHMLNPGEILVCKYTNPSWTPLFASAAAVVTETGSVVSHAAIVAREYGIPAIMGISGITTKIKDGQEIIVDGTSGNIHLVE